MNKSFMEILFFYESSKVALTGELMARRSSTKMILSWCFYSGGGSSYGDLGRGSVPLGMLIRG